MPEHAYRQGVNVAWRWLVGGVLAVGVELERRLQERLDALDPRTGG